jgi:hypothetical protein
MWFKLLDQISSLSFLVEKMITIFLSLSCASNIHTKDLNMSHVDRQNDHRGDWHSWFYTVQQHRLKIMQKKTVHACTYKQLVILHIIQFFLQAILQYNCSPLSLVTTKLQAEPHSLYNTMRNPCKYCSSSNQKKSAKDDIDI